MSTHRRKGFQVNFVKLATVMIAAALGLVAYLIFSRQPVFPALPVGVYTGRLSGVSANEKEFSTLYVERIGGTNALLVVVFEQGWQPTILPLRWNRPEASAEEREKAGLKPLELTLGETSFVLRGTENTGKYSGEVLAANGKRGVWSLTAGSASDLRRTALPENTAFSFHAWLTRKGRYRTLLEEEASLDVSTVEREDKLDKLRAYVAEEEELRARSEQRRGELEARVEALTEEREKKILELKSYARELDQLKRITRRGRAIDLARRVAGRESKWYLVNWEQGMDLSALEEGLALRMKVDLRKLNVQAARAEEIEALKRTVEDEEVQLRRLKQMYKRKLQGPSRDERDRKKDKKDRQDGPWWKRWDTVFG